MKAVQIVNPSEMKVVELEKPAVGVGEVLVRIKYVGFCGSDLNTFLGRNPMVKLPVIPGHEVGAVIEEIGPDVPAGFEKGMNVTLNPYTNCGKCASCRNGRVNACEHNETLGVQRNGVMCEYAVLPWTKIIPAGNISSRDCALIEPMSVGFHAVSRAQVIDNEYVMVIGCGMIGIGAIVRAALRGATVIAVDLDDAGAGGRQGVLPEDPAQVVEQPGDGEHHPGRPEVALPIQEEVGIPVPLCGGPSEPLHGLFLVTGNRLPLQVQLAQHVLGEGIAPLGR